MHRFRVLLSVISVCASAQTPPRFTIQDLGSLSGMPSCVASAISQAGLVAGACGNFATGAETAFVYSGGAIIGLSVNQQTQLALPTVINDSGVVAGFLATRNNVESGNFSITPVTSFLYQNGSVQQPAGTDAGFIPLGITNTGMLSGWLGGNGSTNNFMFTDALTWQYSTNVFTQLATMPGMPLAAAMRMSSDGTWIAGGVGAGKASTHTPTAIVATLWHNLIPQTFPLLSGYQYADAFDVNDSGVAAGAAFTVDVNADSYTPNGSAHAVLFSNARTTDLGVLPGDVSSQAVGINDNGWVIGFSSNQAPLNTLQFGIYTIPVGAESMLANFRAFLYVGGTMYDLAALVENNSGWTLPFANMINNAGQIVGTGLYGGEMHAFVLTPVAAPQVAAVTGAGLSVPAVTTLSPNGIFTVWGANFAPAGTARLLAASDIVGGALPTNLAHTCVEGGGTKWTLSYVSPGQINALAGPLPTSGTVPVSVVANCGTADEMVSAPLNVPVASVAPEFLYFVLETNGQNPVAAIEGLPPYTYVGPLGLLPGVTFTPARAGDVIVAFGVGWGATNPEQTIGVEASGAAQIAANYTLTVGNVPAQVLYAGVSPTYAGLYQIDFYVPDGLPAGNQPIVLTVNGVSSPTGAYIAITQ